MRLLELGLLVFIGGLFGFVETRQNQTKLSKQDESLAFSIDEVSVLNREFLDYLQVFDASTVDNPEDRRCAATLQQLSTAYANRERHGLEWFDSWGKIPSGLYYGNGFAFGNFEQCRRFRWQDGQMQGGQHCTFYALLPNSELPLFQTGLCIPQFCGHDFVLGLYSGYMLTKGVAVMPTQDMCSRDREVEFDGAVVTAIVMFSIVAALVLGSTIYEAVQLFRDQSASELYASFSLYRNVRSILRLVPRSNDPEKRKEFIDCANGVRALSMLWIIVLHVHFQVASIPVSNPSTMLEYILSFPSVVMYFVGTFAVDIFLALSGMLVAWNLLRELDKKSIVNPFMLYLRRYIRITAPLAPIILFVVSFSKYMGEGPHWNYHMGSIVDPCIENWWSTLLFVQNYVHTQTMCLPWTWYLAVDMQLFIIGPALIYPLWRWGKHVLIGIATLAALSISCVFATYLVNEFRIYYIYAVDNGRLDKTYYPTHARMSVWFLGLIFGYILHQTKTSGVHLPKRYFAIGWATCLALLGFIIYATYELQTVHHPDLSIVVDAFYEALSRSAFAICVMWIIFACVNGYGGIVDQFLSSPLWQPLARLSFTMYLLHLVLMMMTSMANVKTELHFSVAELFYRIWGAIGLTTSVSLLWSAIFEVPFMTLEKLLLRSR